MDTKVVVDASVWISRLIPQDTYHNASDVWVEHFKEAGGTLVVLSFFLIEVAGGISRLTGQPALSKRAIEDLNRNYKIQIVPLDSVLVQSAIDIASDLRLRGGDATYVAVARQMNVPLVSWDREHLTRGNTIISTYTPGNYPFEEAIENDNN